MGSQFWSQDSTGIPGTVEKNDRFATSLAIGDFNADHFADVAVGDPNEAVGTLVGAGTVTVIYGTASGLTGTGSQAWDQDSTGIAGSCETGDFFGNSITALNVTSTAHADLVVGVYGESTGTFVSNGAIAVLLGSSTKTGIVSTGNQFIDATNLDNGPQTASTHRYLGMGWSLS